MSRRLYGEVWAVVICHAKRRAPDTYSERVRAAREIAAVEYRAEIRRMMADGALDPGEADEL